MVRLSLLIVVYSDALRCSRRRELTHTLLVGVPLPPTLLCCDYPWRDWQNAVLKETIGTGGFAKVKAARHKMTGEKVRRLKGRGAPRHTRRDVISWLTRASTADLGFDFLQVAIKIMSKEHLASTVLYRRNGSHLLGRARLSSLCGRFRGNRGTEGAAPSAAGMLAPLLCSLFYLFDGSMTFALPFVDCFCTRVWCPKASPVFSLSIVTVLAPPISFSWCSLRLLSCCLAPQRSNLRPIITPICTG